MSITQSPEISHHQDFLCPFISWSKSTGMKTMHFTVKVWRRVKRFSSEHFSFPCLSFPGEKKKNVYYFNKLLVLIHYWSQGWTTGHCITRILKPIMAWHSCTCEKLYQLLNQPTTTSNNNQLSHWKAFCPTMLLALWLKRRSGRRMFNDFQILFPLSLSFLQTLITTLSEKVLL